MAVENFTTYSETDSDGDITVTATKIDVSTMDAQAVSYVTKDKGAGHFGNFEHLITAHLGNLLEVVSLGGIWMVADSIYTYQDSKDASDGLQVHFYRSAVTRKITLRDEVLSNADYYVPSVNTTYYLTIERSGTTATCKIYSDAARTVLVDTLTITCDNKTYRYIHGCYSYDHASNTGDITYYTENLDLQEGGGAHAPTDDANASDAITFKAENHLADDANASDAVTFNAGEHLADNAKASDTPTFKAEEHLADNAKASDSISFQTSYAHNIGDTAKASDALTFDAEINLADIAKASDLYSDDSPPPPVIGYPCPTFTLHGTSTAILFPKPEWANPNNNISKNVELFNFKSGDLDTVDRGINAQPLTIGGTVFIYAGVDNWGDNAAMTVWLDSIKTAMNDGETFEINELGDCLNGVYTIKSFGFNTQKGTVNSFTWSLNLERVKDV